MTKPTFIYARFSTAEQSKGFSLERQLKGGRDFAVEQRKWPPESITEIVDEGRSAYHGKNREVGSALYEFEQRAEAGEFKDGANLVIENVDRLTRQGYEQALDLLRDLNSRGVSVFTWMPVEQFPAGERITLEKVMTVILRAEMSRTESEGKSERIAAGWKERFRKAQDEGKPLTSIVPSWLRFNRDAKTIEAIPERVAVLNEIYDLAIDGHGLPSICKALNSRGEPTWTKGRRKDASKLWDNSRIHKLLTSRAVMGEYEPHKGAAIQGVIPDYYPQVISPDKFNRVQAVRQSKPRAGGRSRENLSNLFPMARCAECAGKMNITSRKRAGHKRAYTLKDGTRRYNVVIRPISYLRCERASRGACRNTKLIRYEGLEEGIVAQLLGSALLLHVQHTNPVAERLAHELANHQRLIETKERSISNLMASMEAEPNPILARRVSQLAAEIEQHRKDAKGIGRQLDTMGSGPSHDEALAALADVQDKLQDEDETARYAARAKARVALAKLISRIECSREGHSFAYLGDDAVRVDFGPDGQMTGSAVLQREVFDHEGNPMPEPE